MNAIESGSRFGDRQSSHKTSFTFEQWRGWRERHGFVCDVDEDCSWLTRAKNMGCSRGEFGRVRSLRAL